MKWSRNLKRALKSDKREPFNDRLIGQSAFRPFVKKWLYRSPLFADEHGRTADLLPAGKRNPGLLFTDPTGQKPWFPAAVDEVPDLHFVGGGAGAVCMTRYRYVGAERLDNITDWALEQFTAHYGPKVAITKDDIFHYVYACCTTRCTGRPTP